MHGRKLAKVGVGIATKLAAMKLQDLVLLGKFVLKEVVSEVDDLLDGSARKGNRFDDGQTVDESRDEEDDVKSDAEGQNSELNFDGVAAVFHHDHRRDGRVASGGIVIVHCFFFEEYEALKRVVVEEEGQVKELIVL